MIARLVTLDGMIIPAEYGPCNNTNYCTVEYGDDGEITLQSLQAGVEDKDISVTYTNGMIKVSVDVEKFHSKSFSKYIGQVNPDSITAELKNGILTIKAQRESKQIKVKVK